MGFHSLSLMKSCQLLYRKSSQKRPFEVKNVSKAGGDDDNDHDDVRMTTMMATVMVTTATK